MTKPIIPNWAVFGSLMGFVGGVYGYTRSVVAKDDLFELQELEKQKNKEGK
eukprot:CAMPEP_0197847190 /NCGR_PEP_ID=MMETSP1438-20131217/5453_1 /TAXON_ID=1461541 /ORGANISM="Pterosperma sp., Strain CCMP1384" /LENGTH=50 /DNA_ID=CAMNT_0043459049 /DNA_START=102 /DNA_END=254 /DNA_ORIENTATION=+